MNLRLSHCRRALALLLCALTLMSLLPSAAFAGQVDDYHDPAAHWMTSSNRTNQLDINSVVTQETLHCYICGTDTPFTVWRVPEYTRDGASALMRNVQFSDGTTVDGSGTGAVNDGTPGVDAYYTGFHWTKSSCNMCGSFNANHDASDYCFSKNVYKLYDCAAEFIDDLDETVTYEYADDHYHRRTVRGGTYCVFCFGTRPAESVTLERHTPELETIPQLSNQRFALVEHCIACEYVDYSFVAAKCVIADYYGVVDGEGHTVTISDLSEPGVTTAIRYDYTAENCTLTSAPNFTEEGQYVVFYEITYTYRGASMVENGAAYVWLRDENGGCACGCGRSDCDCGHTGCTGNCCGSCGDTHNFTLIETVLPTCSQLGYERYVCVNCGLVEKRNYVSAIGHAYQSVVIRAADCETEGKILDICRNCGDVKETVTPKGEHHYRTYNIASTCTAPGYTVRECKVCGERHIENITEPAGHSFVSYATPPTCTTGGHILHICSVCGESFIDNYLPATGHSMDDGRALTPAACDHDGVMEYTCVTCGHTVREPIPATGHTPGPAATCADPQLCAICGAVLAQANGHSFRSAVVLPTCLEMGHTDYVCADCGFAYDGDYVNPLGHNHIGVITAPTCTERGFTTYTCSRCGDSYVSDYVGATGHFWDEGAVIKDPTCETDGMIEYRCTVCGITRLEDYSGSIASDGNPHTRSTAVTVQTLSLMKSPITTVQSANLITASTPSATTVASAGGGTGHTYIGSVTAPTCGERGFTTYTCITCGDTYVSDFTEALGHNYKTAVTAATCTALGYTSYTCSRCGDS